MTLAPGSEQQPHGALKRESDLTSHFPRMLVVDEHPVRRMLLAQHDHLNLAHIQRVCPGRQRGGHHHLNHADMALLHKEVNGWSIVCSPTQAVDDHLGIDLAGNEDVTVQREQQTQLAQLAQRH